MHLMLRINTFGRVFLIYLSASLGVEAKSFNMESKFDKSISFRQDESDSIPAMPRASIRTTAIIEWLHRKEYR